MIVIVGVVVGAAVGGYLVWDHYRDWKESKDNQQAALSVTPPSDNISLKEAEPVPSNDTNSLKVDTSLNNSNPAQLGSGQTQSNSSSSSSNSNNQAPGPESFGQYDQYKDGQNGLYADLQVGTGNEVKAGSKVAVYYKGWLTNGTLFDQSRAGDDGKLQPFVFTVGNREVITGWEQTIVGMKVGGTRRMIIPPAVGYGEKGQGPIPANSVLVFDVQLVAMQ